MIKKAHGFTIVELLIVIVVIAILAAISIVAYTGIQERAQAASVASALKSIDRAFRLKLADDGASAWWTDSSLGGNPSLTTLITNTNLKDYLSVTATPVGSTGAWFYDNDSDTYGGCSSAGAPGVNIVAYGMSSNVAVWTAVDKQIDDGNLSCGKLRYNASDNGGAIYWSLGNNSSSGF